METNNKLDNKIQAGLNAHTDQNQTQNCLSYTDSDKSDDELESNDLAKCQDYFQDVTEFNEDFNDIIPEQNKCNIDERVAVENNSHDSTNELIEKINQLESQVGHLKSELKRIHSNYSTKLTDLTSAKNDAESKLKTMRRYYEEGLTKLDAIKVEQIFKNSGAIEHLKERDSVKHEVISNLKSELEAKRKEAVRWKDKYQECEKQCSTHWQTVKELEMKVIQLEAEKRVIPDHSGMLSMSSASSFIDPRIPPAPPVDILSADELLALPLNNFYGQNSRISVSSKRDRSTSSVELRSR